MEVVQWDLTLLPRLVPFYFLLLNKGGAGLGCGGAIHTLPLGPC